MVGFLPCLASAPGVCRAAITAGHRLGGVEGTWEQSTAPQSLLERVTPCSCVALRFWVRHTLVPRGRCGTCGCRRCGAPGLGFSTAAVCNGYQCRETSCTPCSTYVGGNSLAQPVPGAGARELHAVGLSVVKPWGCSPSAATRWEHVLPPATVLGKLCSQTRMLQAAPTPQWAVTAQHGALKKYLLPRNRKCIL